MHALPTRLQMPSDNETDPNAQHLRPHLHPNLHPHLHPHAMSLFQSVVTTHHRSGAMVANHQVTKDLRMTRDCFPPIN